MKLRGHTEPGKHPRITIHRNGDRASAVGPVLATVHCHENNALVDYDAKRLDGPTFNELTRSVRDAMGQIKTLICGPCGRIPRG
jgi:hypothetical protein